MKEWPIMLAVLLAVALIKADDTSVKPNRIDMDALNKVIVEKDPHFVETFNDKTVLNKKWIVSTAKKDGIEADIAAYDGDWLIDAPMKHAMLDDFGLMFKQRAKHRAISALLKKDFVFNDTPFVLQYEVLFQEGQECGGGYIKLITGERNAIKLQEFHDKTPYTIMFGPDKCGSTNKVHFIFRHKNPLNGSFEEKHVKPMTNRVDEIFTDGKPHLFGLVLLPDNTFKLLIDQKVVNEGSLLNDFTPPVNPPAEIDDPTDIKPENWDDREKIPDPDASKPEDWDEDAPATITDPTATKPDNWLDHEPLYIRDPSAEKPHDWDVEMDGEWEAPLVPNPACEDAAGCGEWTPPKINNPAYKGKWTPPLIPNPEYKGKWSPRKIPNIDYFEDKEPFKMEKIVAVGFELWSMSPSIMFDNILLTDSEDFAKLWAEMTYTVKMQNIEQSADTYFNQFVAFTNRYPWLWAMYTVLLLILVTLIVYCCFWNLKDNYEHKKTDASQPDDPVQSEESVQSPDDTILSDVSRSNDSVQLEDTASPDDTAKLDDSAKSADSVKSDDSTKSDDSAKSADPIKPAEERATPVKTLPTETDYVEFVSTETVSQETHSATDDPIEGGVDI